MNIKTNLTTANFVKANRTKIDYIVIHYTANNGDTAAGNAKYFHSAYRGASAHYFVDQKEIVQVVQEKDIAWHCGDTQKYIQPGGARFKGICKNANSIGIELCSVIVDGVYQIPEKTQDNAAELVRMLMEKYRVSVGRVIRHFDVTGKICPRPFVDDPAQWERFKRKLEEEDMTEDQTRKMIQEEIQKALTGTKTAVPAWAVQTGEWAAAQKDGITDGTRPGGYTTRAETAAMIQRAKKGGK